MAGGKILLNNFPRMSWDPCTTWKKARACQVAPSKKPGVGSPVGGKEPEAKEPH